MGTPPPTWEDIAWLREQWGGPFMLKGMMRVDDAKRAVDAGVSAISVSNHGGNNLDGTPATDPGAAGDRRRGRRPGRGAARRRHPPRQRRRQGRSRSGARAVMIGRAYLWGLAADGQAGVENVLDILRGGIDSALRGLGKSSIHDLTPGRHPGARRLHPRARVPDADGPDAADWRDADG